MTAEPATANPVLDRDPEGARLLGLVRVLLVLARALLGTLRSLGSTSLPIDIAYRFRCLDLTVIIARVTRGLLIAEALEARLLRRRPRGAPAAPRQPSVRTSGAPQPPRRTDADDDAELRGPLPSAEQIAARIRRRPIGAVFVDICRDLGIDTSHPDWREIQKAIVFNGGNMVTMLRHWTRHLPNVTMLVSHEAASRTATQAPPPGQIAARVAADASRPVTTAATGYARLRPPGQPAANRPASMPRPSAVSVGALLMPDLLSSTSLSSTVIQATAAPLSHPPLGAALPLPAARPLVAGDVPSRPMSRHAVPRASLPQSAPRHRPPILATALPP